MWMLLGIFWSITDLGIAEIWTINLSVTSRKWTRIDGNSSVIRVHSTCWLSWSYLQFVSTYVALLAENLTVEYVNKKDLRSNFILDLCPLLRSPCIMWVGAAEFLFNPISRPFFYLLRLCYRSGSRECDASIRVQLWGDVSRHIASK